MMKLRKKPKLTNRVKNFLEDVQAPENSQQLEQLRMLLRERCKNDLHFFAYHVLEFHDMDTPLHYDMARRWQRRSKAQYSLWLVPRGHLKTSLWTEAGTLWEFINNPNQRYLIVNAKKENAADIIANIKSYVETKEIFRWLFPEYCWDLAPRSKRARCKVGAERLDFPCSKYAGAKEGCIEVMGVEASLVSKHYDVMVYDDAVNDLNTETMAYRNKVERWYRNSLQLRHSPHISRVRIIGTRWHFNDLYSRIITKEKKYRASLLARGKKVCPRYWLYIRCVVEKVEKGGRDIARKKNVLPIWPERFTDNVVEDLLVENGSYIFSCQYMNNPLPDEDTIFKHDQIKVVSFWEIPENVSNFLALDLAVDNKEESDYSAIVVASFDEESKMYVREIIRKKLLPKQALDIIAHLVEKWRIQRVAIETHAFQSTVLSYYKEYSAREGWNIPWVEMKRGMSSKIRRFLALQPRVERGDFLVEDGIAHMDDMIEEMTTLSFDHLPSFDDILDCLSDLEQVYYRAPKEEVEEVDRATYDGFYGSIYEDDDEWSEEVSCRGPSRITSVSRAA